MRWFPVGLVIAWFGLVHQAELLPEDAATDMKQLRAILTSPSADRLELQAAQTLATYLQKMYGVRVPVNPEGMAVSKETSQIVIVGRDAALSSGIVSAEDIEKVKHDGFVLRVGQGRIAMAGYRPRGSVYAAYAFLERLGCRFYAPSCEVVPQPDTSLISTFAADRKPAMDFRSGNAWMLGESAGDVGDPRQALNPELFTEASGSGLWIDHTAGYLVPKALYYDDHPDYFSLRRDGTRIPKTVRDSYVHLCLSHPDVRRISAERALGWIRLQPDKRFFCITVGDGVDWCQCDKCKAIDVTPGNYSDRLLSWVNHVAREVKKEFPDKVLFTFGYCGTDTPPEREKPEENVWLLYCPYWGVALSMVHPITHPSNAEAQAMLEGWLKAAPRNVGIYDYNMYYTPSWDTMARKVKWYADKGIRGIWHCGRPQCFSELFSYLVSRLEWDPSLDVQTLKEGYVQAYYGPAAPHVLQYLRLVENRLEHGYPKGCHEFFMPADFYSYETLIASLLLFDRMKDAAAGNAALIGKIESERQLMLNDYQKAVTLRTPGLTTAERNLAIQVMKDALERLLAQDEDLGRQLSAPGLAADRADKLKKDREGLHKSIVGKIAHFTGAQIPTAAQNIDLALSFLKDPDALIRQYPEVSLKTAPEKLANGLRLPATAFEGGVGPREYAWFCEPRMSMTAYAAKGPRPSRMWAEFALESEPAGAATLKIEGQDADKDLPPKSQMVVIINDRVILDAPCRFVRRGWSWDSIPIDKGVLRKGANRIELRNATASGRLDHYWFMVAEAQLVLEAP